jgi:hypothetical protein
MSFWSTTEAAPSLLMAAGFQTITPRYIRTEPVTSPAHPTNTVTIRAQPKHTRGIADFWRTHYAGAEWKYDQTHGVLETLVESYINDLSVYFFILLNTVSNTIVATIVSAPAGPVQMSHGGALPQCRVIEGLCVHREHRGKKYAGYLISYMDAQTSRSGPVAHLWARELPFQPPITTAFSTKTYAYVIASQARKIVSYTHMNVETLGLLWKTYSSSWIDSTEPVLVCSEPILRRNDIHVFKAADHTIAVITNTRRVAVGAQEGAALWEVLWCGSLRSGKLEPLLTMSEVQDFLASIATELGGILFASGGIDELWLAPWQPGRSGIHAWYLYNYVPPAFGSCALHMIREEI